MLMCLVFIFCFKIIWAYDFYYTDLDEGSPCRLAETFEVGECVLMPQCPRVLEQVRNRQRWANSENHCGFKGHVETVCCSLDEIVRPESLPKPSNIVTKNESKTTTSTTVPSVYQINLRRAEAACLIINAYKNEINNHIVNGVFSKPKEFPFLAALGYASGQDPTKIEYSCGGTLIYDKYVLTAAHCVKNIHKRVPIEVKLGAMNLKKHSKGEENVKIKNITCHPRYRINSNYHDVAVIELNRSINYTDYIIPTCLSLESILNLSEMDEFGLVVAGWGSTDSYDTSISDDLLKADGLGIIKNNDCQKYYNDHHRLNRGLDDSVICVRDKNTTRYADTCQGDSGGPLLLRNKNDVLGIVSTGQFCGSSVPSLYTSVNYHLDWIEDVVWPMSEKIEN